MYLNTWLAEKALWITQLLPYRKKTISGLIFRLTKLFVFWIFPYFWSTLNYIIFETRCFLFFYSSLFFLLNPSFLLSLSKGMYTKFITVNRFQNQHDRLKSIKHLTRNLPDYHFETLQFLIRHLKVIVEHSEKNKVRYISFKIIEFDKLCDNHWSITYSHGNKICILSVRQTGIHLPVMGIGPSLS